MVSLVDIGAQKSSVTIRGQNLDVNGLTAADILELFMSYPNLRRVVTGNADSEVLAAMFAMFPTMIGQVVAMACANGEKVTQEMIDAAAKLSVGEQWMILEKAMPLTFPQGPKVFVDGLFAAAGQSSPWESGVTGWAPGTTSQPPSSDASAQEDSKPIASETPPSSLAPGSSSSSATS